MIDIESAASQWALFGRLRGSSLPTSNNRSEVNPGDRYFSYSPGLSFSQALKAPQGKIRHKKQSWQVDADLGPNSALLFALCLKHNYIKEGPPKSCQVMSLMFKKRFKAEANMNSRIMKTFLIFISTLYKSWGAVKILHVHQPISTKLIIALFDGGKAVLHLPSCFQVGNMLQASPYCQHADTSPVRPWLQLWTWELGLSTRGYDVRLLQAHPSREDFLRWLPFLLSLRIFLLCELLLSFKQLLMDFSTKVCPRFAQSLMDFTEAKAFLS